MITRLKTRGFTLVEMAVVLGIISVVLGSAISLFSASLDGRALRVTQERMKIIQQTLYDYRLANDRIPCPGDAELAMSSQYFGKEGVFNGTTANVVGTSYTSGACVSGSTYDGNGNKTATGTPVPTANSNSIGSVRGMIPVRTLGLSDEFAFDGWGRRVMYTVDRRYTMVNGFSNWKLFEKPATALGTNRVQFLGADTVTGGNWIGRFGSDGYVFANSTSNLPSYAGVTPTGAALFTWGSSNQVRNYFESINASGGTRYARCWYSSSSFTLAVNVGVNPRVVTMYMLDSDGTTRDAIIYAKDGGTVLDTRDTSKYINNFNGGMYFRWVVQGNITFQVVNGPTSNAVISSIFFDTPDYVTAADEGTINSSRILVKDANSNIKVDKAVYVLWSAGKNGHGGYSRAASTSLINAASTNAQEYNNCDCDATATKTTFDAIFYDGSATASTFDDVITYATRPQLRSASE